MQIDELERRLEHLAGPVPEVPVESVRARARRVHRRRRYRSIGVATVVVIGGVGTLALVDRSPVAAPATTPTPAPTAMADPDQAAFEALRNGDLPSLLQALDRGAAADATTIDDLTLLMVATYRGDTAATSALIDAGADVTATSIGGATALALAASEGHVAVAELLIANGADPAPTPSTPWAPSPLHMAVTAGHVPMVRLLVDAGADPNSATPTGRPMLLCALDAPDADAVIDTLLELGAELREPETGVRLSVDDLTDSRRRAVLSELDRRGSS